MRTIHVRARPDPSPSRGLWLVKWLLLIPHYVVLAFLGAAFVVLTLIAYVAVLFTGRYPEGIFHFNVGVLRWSWRVGYYGYQALGTDRYPPFTLAEVPDYPAGLTVDGPPRLPRWLPLVAWLFAVPHLVIIGALNGAATWQVRDDTGAATTVAPLSVVAAAVLVLGFGLLFTGRRPAGLHDLLVGVGRWTLRTVAYVALLTGEYPPFRLDQGGEPSGPGPEPAPTAAAVPPVMTPAPPPTSGSAAGWVVAIVAGVLMLFTAVGLGVGGATVLTLNGQRDASGILTSQSLAVTSSTAAITVDGLRPGALWAQEVADIGDVRITVTGAPGTDLFLGVGRQADVDRWLAGTAHDQLVEVYTADTARYERADGAVRGISAPATQDFWAARATGSGTVALDWAAVDDGPYAIVLANAAGTAGVTGTATVAIRVPSLAPVGWGLVGGGAALAIMAFVLIHLGASGLGRRHGPPPPPWRPGPAPAMPPGDRRPVGVG